MPDGLLLGLLGFLLGLTALIWTSTGLSGLFAKGAWPTGVTFPNTLTAMRRLASEPHNIPGAWPASPPAEFSGYGLFWGIFISQLLVLLVLTIFLLGVFTRWRLVRARTRESRLHPDAPPRPLGRRSSPSPLGRRGRPPGAERAGKGAAPAPRPHPTPAHPTTPTPSDTPHPNTPRPTPAEAEPGTGPGPGPGAGAEDTPTPTPQPLLFNRPTHHPTALRTILEAPGPALVLTSTPTLWQETKDARAKLGPVLLYDPEHRCDTPARLHWSPTAGCEDPLTAASRAAALLAPVRPRATADSAIAETAETLLAAWLHAAAIDARPFKHLLRWAQGSSAHEPVRILRTHPKARSGAAGLLESALTAYPERREQAQNLTTRAFSALSSIHLREACTPNRTDSLTLESFVVEGGTLYMVGESIEDPRTRPTGPGAMPLLTALASHVVEHGRRMAARSTDGRLDPPMTLVLDDVAAVAPLPQLPELLTAGQGQGLPTLALLRSQEQFNSAWPKARC
ncbi:type IV secretory system conjugative DNA transfer family protein [Streptomyces sp. NBC_00237]|uniref:type IV secretory system conjugative DNA transfer family protein n=1 Tax=Streptomyces sp. NBC_00237 TaxID=2975687 RepID=UPI00225A06CA|nr:type IV secretory system conjugative DNA transfer family protein [Streptomyces sp. NBC_00237]MCX5207231.1 type IV secretory system conjugative DNA transfer family protein [Streptomyces sp. NBC_00237]